MALVTTFNNIKTHSSVKITDLKPQVQYKVLESKKIKTKYGETVSLKLKINEQTASWVFLPKRYTNVFTEIEITNINSGQSKIALEYHGICVNTKAYLLTLHAQ